MLQAAFGILVAAAIVFSIGLWATHSAKAISGQTRTRTMVECQTSSTQLQDDATTGAEIADALQHKKTVAANTTIVLTAEGGGIGPHSRQGTNGL